ncbi:MAG TPA: hypothetical protein VGS08_00880 [Candidatus Saccharimonadales bacterium]|nr:hypothetical protein [Candidatus Saccharimonadales bacterium]
MSAGLYGHEIRSVFPGMMNINTDNDILWAYHAKLEELLGVPFTFVTPTAHGRKEASRITASKLDIMFIKALTSQYSDQYLQMAEAKLNGRRYMTVLGYQKTVPLQNRKARWLVSRLGATRTAT